MLDCRKTRLRNMSGDSVLLETHREPQRAMKKITLAALLIACSFQAPPTSAQDNARAQAEAPLQVQASKQVVREIPIDKEAAQKLIDLGYTFNEQPRVFVKAARCAIPLMSIRVPDRRNFEIKKAPANSAIDSKIVVAPPLPACPQSSAKPTTPIPSSIEEKPLDLAKDK